MKKLSALCLVVLLLAASAPVASARPRDRDRDALKPPILKIIKKVFGIFTNENQPVVPRP